MKKQMLINLPFTVTYTLKSTLFSTVFMLNVIILLYIPFLGQYSPQNRITLQSMMIVQSRLRIT